MPTTPDDPWRPRTPAGPWAAGPGNPRTYPSRPRTAVDREILHSEQQRRELEASMTATGQTGALVLAPLRALSLTNGRACTSTTWTEGPVTVLPRADVLALTELPATIEAGPRTTWVRWDVVARVCGPTCWRAIAELEPQRVITSSWPSAEALAIVHGLALPHP